VAPVALLVAVAGAGLLGPKADPDLADASLAVGSSSPGPSPEAAFRRDPPPWVPDTPFPATPAGIERLDVQSVQDARDALSGGRPIAVRGWLGGLVRPATCAYAWGDTRAFLSPLCERGARLVTGEAGADNPSAHLHLTIPPGVRLPPEFEALEGAEAAALPVVVIGRADPPGADCRDGPRGCREQLTVDAVAWAGDGTFEPGPVWDAGLEVSPPSVAYRRLPAALSLLVEPGDGVPLISAILRPATVADVDTEAGAALAQAPEPDGLVWYVRSLHTTRTPGTGAVGADIRWALLDEATGRRIATGVAGEPARTAIAPPMPLEVDGLRVETVRDLLEATRADPRASRAVTGFLVAWAEPGACEPLRSTRGCERHAVLAAESWAVDGLEGTEPPGEHLHARIPPGVVVPQAALEADGRDPDGLPAEVVAVVRPTRPADCDAGDDCAAWTVVGVPWTEGDGAPPGA
jgi:hypothetical protein